MINPLKCDADFKNTINQNLIIILNLMIILKDTSHLRRLKKNSSSLLALVLYMYINCFYLMRCINS